MLSIIRLRQHVISPHDIVKTIRPECHANLIAHTHTPPKLAFGCQTSGSLLDAFYNRTHPGHSLARSPNMSRKRARPHTTHTRPHKTKDGRGHHTTLAVTRPDRQTFFHIFIPCVCTHTRAHPLKRSQSCLSLSGWMDGWIDGWMDGWMDGWNER